jgi:hypothetical protein
VRASPTMNLGQPLRYGDCPLHHGLLDRQYVDQAKLKGRSMSVLLQCLKVSDCAPDVVTTFKGPTPPSSKSTVFGELLELHSKKDSREEKKEVMDLKSVCREPHDMEVIMGRVYEDHFRGDALLYRDSWWLTLDNCWRMELGRASIHYHVGHNMKWE